MLRTAEGAYRTGPTRVSPLARLFPSLFFYMPFFAIMGRAALIARRGRYDDGAWVRTSAAIIRSLERVGVRFEITGLDHLQALAGPCVIAGNHMTTLETAALPAIIQPIKKVTFVVKRGLLEYPGFKHVMRARDPIAVTQTNPREDLKAVLAEGAERLAQGVSVVVFPQGARTAVFDATRFNTIGLKLAQRSEVPIVPLALTTAAWRTGKWIRDLGRIDPAKTVRFAFGEPLWVRGRGIDEHRAVIDFIERKLQGWRAEDCE